MMLVWIRARCLSVQSLLTALAVVLLCARPALALTIEVSHAGPSIVGEPHDFTVTATDAVGEVSFEWRFADTGTFEVGEAQMSHTFDTPGLHSVDVAAIDA